MLLFQVSDDEDDEEESSSQPLSSSQTDTSKPVSLPQSSDPSKIGTFLYVSRFGSVAKQTP